MEGDALQPQRFTGVRTASAARLLKSELLTRPFQLLAIKSADSCGAPIFVALSAVADPLTVWAAAPGSGGAVLAFQSKRCPATRKADLSDAGTMRASD